MSVKEKKILLKDTKMAWYNMHERCYNTRHESYKSYGGKGVTVHPTWRKYYDEDGNRPEILTPEIRQHDSEARNNFMCDVKLKPANSSQVHLGRKDDKGNYEPGNCSWELYESKYEIPITAAHADMIVISAHFKRPEILAELDVFEEIYGAKVFTSGAFTNVFDIKMDPTSVGKFLSKFNMSTGLIIAFRQRGCYNYKVVSWSLFEKALSDIKTEHMGRLPLKIGTGATNPSVYF